jgi:hypothetical protein
MLNMLKVLGRVFLICIGLLSIAGGGFCVAMGNSSDSLGGLILTGLVGLFGLMLGAVVVWMVFQNWQGSRAEQQSGAGEQSANEDRPL